VSAKRALDNLQSAVDLLSSRTYLSTDGAYPTNDMEVNAPRGISTSRPEQSAQTEWDAKAKTAKESKRIMLETILKIFS
jgi:hypothetical protein